VKESGHCHIQGTILLCLIPKKTTRNLSHNGWSLSKELNPGHLKKYETGVPPI
jgi:hypothetical protein